MLDFFSQNYQWLIPLLIGGILTPFSISYLQNRKNNNQSKELKPEIHITENWDRHFFNIEILNTGEEDIINFYAKIYWKQDEANHERELEKFITENEDQLFASPRNFKILRAGEKIIAVNIPHFSDDGKIKVEIRGIGSASKKSLKEEIFVPNKEK